MIPADIWWGHRGFAVEKRPHALGASWVSFRLKTPPKGNEFAILLSLTALCGPNVCCGSFDRVSQEKEDNEIVFRHVL
jgi:hypothetical protein